MSSGTQLVNDTRSGWRLALTAPRSMGGLLGIAAALACWPASVFIIGWHRGMAERVARVPQALWLVGALLLPVTGALAITWARRRKVEARSLDLVLWPLSWLGVLAIPFIPVLADLFPELTVLAGPLRWVIAAAVAAACAWPLVASWTTGALRWRVHPLMLVTAGLAVYVVTGLWVTRTQPVGGDEPHYLVIVESLLRDGDLRVENNYDDRDYDAFMSIVDLPPDFRRRGVGDVMYSIHAPGLPMLVLPAYALGGRVAVNVFLGFLAALGGLAVFRLASAIGGSGPALVTWAGVTLTTPWLMHGWLIYPEMPAACIVAWALWWLWSAPSARPRVWAWRGAVIGYLPWLHSKFSVLLVGIALVHAVRLLRRPAALVSFALPVGLSVAGWFYAFYVMYGVADPTVPYGGLASLGYEYSWTNIPRGLLGLAFDQEYGLLLYSPLYLVALCGVWPLLGRREARPVLLCSALAGGAFLATTTRYYMWWGGWSVPARFALPLLPMAAALLAAGVARVSRGPTGRAVTAALFAVSLAAAVVLCARPSDYMMFNDRDGMGKLLEMVQGPAPLTSIFPSLLWIDWRTQLPRIAVPITGLVTGLLMLWLAARRGRLAAWPEGRLVLLFVVSVVAGVVLGGRIVSSASMRQAMVRDGQLQLFDAWSTDHFVDVSHARNLRRRDLLSRLRMTVFDRRVNALETPPDDLREWIGPLQLPPGRFEVLIWLQGRGAGPGEFLASVHRSRAVVGSAMLSGEQPLRIPISLPEAFVPRPIWVGVSAADLIDRVARVDLVALDIQPRALRATEQATAIENVEGWPGGLLVYLDHQAHAEGGVFWTRGESDASLMVMSSGAQAMQIALEAGAAAGNVSLEIDGTPMRFALTPYGAKSIPLTLRPDQSVVRLHVGFTGGFRPHDVDPTSPDRRWLGVRVRVTLS